MDYLIERRILLRQELAEINALIDVFDFLKSLTHDWGEGEERVVAEYTMSQWKRSSNRSKQTWQLLREDLIRSYQYTTRTEGISPPFIGGLDKRIKKYFQTVDSNNK